MMSANSTCFCTGRKQVCCSYMQPWLFSPDIILCVREEVFLSRKCSTAQKALSGFIW